MTKIPSIQLKIFPTRFNLMLIRRSDSTREILLGEDDPMEVDGSHGGQGGMIDQSGMDFYYQDLMKYIPTLSHFLVVVAFTQVPAI